VIATKLKSGTIGDFLESRRDFLIVVGNSEPHERNGYGDMISGATTDALCAMKLQDFYLERGKMSIRIDQAVVPGDREFVLTDNEKNGMDLLLVGAQKANAIVADLPNIARARELPIPAQERLLSHGNVGAILAYKSTFNPQRQFLILMGHKRTGTLACALALFKHMSELRDCISALVEGIVKDGVVIDAKIIAKNSLNEKGRTAAVKRNRRQDREIYRGAN
jgi:hypothetical protein